MSASLVCPHCGYANPEGAGFCADCAGVLKPTDLAEMPPGQYVRPADARKASDPLQCSSCKIPMEQTRDVPFRIGGYAGVRRLIIGQVADVAEHLLSVDLYICPKCGNIQLYANQTTKQDLPRALPRS
jgi:predicted RNA-binding Zn-ribbon protein involved in translation (DUF1610 family)